MRSGHSPRWCGSRSRKVSDTPDAETAEGNYVTVEQVTALQEDLNVATAAKNDLPIIVIIMNNNSLGMVRQWQNFFYEGRYASTTLNRTTDFVKVAEAFGGKGFRVFEKEELVPILKEAIEYKGPVVIDYVIHNDKKVFPMVAPGAPINQIIDEEDV